jgi:hypothetical protein
MIRINGKRFIHSEAELTHDRIVGLVRKGVDPAGFVVRVRKGKKLAKLRRSATVQLVEGLELEVAPK